MLPFINPLPLVITLAAAFGVLFHDTQFDRAATTSLAAPITTSQYGGIETALRLNDGLHTQTERTSITTSMLPAIRPRMGEDKKYIIDKRLATNSFDSDFLVPLS
jgi:hypothetical protein